MDIDTDVDLKSDELDKINIENILKIDKNINNSIDLLDYDLNVY